MSQSSEDRGDRVLAGSGGRRGTAEEYGVQRAGPTGHRRGLAIPATLAGTMAAVGTLILLGGLLGAALGEIGNLTGPIEELSIGGVIAGIVVVFLAFFVGGWTAAAIARHDGPKQGLLSAVWFIVLAAILVGLGAFLGSAYNIFDTVGIQPQWLPSSAPTIGAIITGIVALAAMFLGAWLGGKVGHPDAYDVVEIHKGERVAVRDGGILQRAEGDA